MPVILGGAVLASALYALIGLGVGALIRNQVAAIAVAVGWLWLTETVIVATVPAAGKWLVGGALQALVQVHAGLTVVKVPDLLLLRAAPRSSWAMAWRSPPWRWRQRSAAISPEVE